MSRARVEIVVYSSKSQKSKEDRATRDGIYEWSVTTDEQSIALTPERSVIQRSVRKGVLSHAAPPFQRICRSRLAYL